MLVCVMFGFHPRTVHVFKDNAYDDNNNVIISIYQVPIIDELGLKWMVNVEIFMIIAKNLSKAPKMLFSCQKLWHLLLGITHVVKVK